MLMVSKSGVTVSGAVARLSSFAALTSDDCARIRSSEREQSWVQRHRDLIRVGDPVAGPIMVAGGWAYRGHLLPDGRRQIIDLILPGEVINICFRQDPLAVVTITTLTEVVTFPAPRPDPNDAASGLAQAYAVSAAIEEAHLCRQVRRLGRMSAYERMIDWLLETHDRLALTGMVDGADFTLPLTQEAIGDLLGLTSVHVNRTLKALRDDGMATAASRVVRLHDRARMERVVGYKPVRTVQ